jgi:hypothetical protein
VQLAELVVGYQYSVDMADQQFRCLPNHLCAGFGLQEYFRGDGKVPGASRFFERYQLPAGFGSLERGRILHVLRNYQMIIPWIVDTGIAI